MADDTFITGDVRPGARKLAFTTYDAITVLLAVVFIIIALAPAELLALSVLR